MVLLNDLLTEAIERSQAVSEDALTAEQALEAVAKRATEMAEGVETKSQEAHDRFRALSEELEHAQGELSSTAADARCRLEQAATKAAEVETEADELLERVKKGTGELEARKTRVAEELETETEATRNALADLASRITNFENDLGRRVDETLDGLSDLSQETEALRVAVPAAWEEFNQGLEELEEGAAEKMQTLADAFEGSMARQTSLFSDLGEKLVEEHNRAIEAFVKRFTEDLFSQMEQAVAPLKSAVDVLEGFCEDGQELATNQLGEVKDKLGEVRELLARIQPALEMTGQLK
jgi:DNA repair exonuclease SbcCD ATPase subunit